MLPENPAPLYGRAGQPYTGHPGPKVPGVRFPTGSLGHGVPYAAGWALARRIGGHSGLGIAVAGDGELQEGLVWETCQVAAARSWATSSSSWTATAGRTTDSSPTSRRCPASPSGSPPSGSRSWRRTGTTWRRCPSCSPGTGRPHAALAVVAHTVKGKGVPAVEGKAGSHYVTIDATRAAKWKRAIR
ncbi:hypothetical protein ACFQ3Z_24775 [Streptomyces nogalater]